MIPRPVLLVPGIHTSDEDVRRWQDGFGAYLRDLVPGRRVLVYNPGWTAAITIDMPGVGWLGRRHEVKQFQRWLKHELPKIGNPIPDVVAHSFGTYLTHHSMSDKPGPKAFFNHVVYMGGVVSTMEDFRSTWGHWETMTCLYSHQDEVVRWALPPLGQCGIRGFRSAPPAENLEMNGFKHTDYLDPRRGRAAWEAVAARVAT
jgi:hypothetical protein